MSSKFSKVMALSLAQGISSATLIASSIICTRYLSMEDLATYKQTMLAYEFAVPFLTLGIPSAMYYFLSGAKERQRGIILDNVALMLVMGSIFSIFLLGGGTRLLAMRFHNPALKESLRWFVFFPLLTFPMMSLSSVLIIYDRITLASFFQVISRFLLIGCVIVSCILTRSYRWPLFSKIIMAAISLIAMLIIVFRIVREGTDWPRISNFLPILKFAVPLGIASIAGSISVALDKVIVSAMCSPKDFSVYASGAMQLPFVGIITGSITTVMLAEMSLLCRQGKLAETLALFRQIPCKTALFLFPLMIFCMIYSREIIVILFGNRYRDSALPFFLYLCSIPISIVTYGSAFTALNKTRQYMQVSVEELCVNCLISIVLVYFWGAWGAALGTVLACYFWAIPRLIHFLAKDFHCSWKEILPFRRLGEIMLLTLLAGCGAFTGYFFTLPIIRILLGGISFSLLYFLLVWHYLPDSRDVLLIPFRKVLHCKK